jgi:hypothetical protein
MSELERLQVLQNQLLQVLRFHRNLRAEQRLKVV